MNVIPEKQLEKFLNPSFSLNLLFKKRKIEFSRHYPDACQLGYSQLDFVTGPDGKFYVHLSTELDYAQLQYLTKGDSEDLLYGIPYGLTIHNVVQKKGQAFDRNHGLKEAICTHFILEDPGNSIYDRTIDPSCTHLVATQLLAKLEGWLETHGHIPRLESDLSRFLNSTVFFNPVNQKVSILARRGWWVLDFAVRENLEAINRTQVNIFPIASNTQRGLEESLKTATQAVDHYTINNAGWLSPLWAPKKILSDYIQLLKATIRDSRIARIRLVFNELGLEKYNSR